MTEQLTTTPLAEEVRDWLQAHWDPDQSLAEWRDVLVDSGWACPSWPKEWYGRGLPDAAREVVDAQFRQVGAVGPATGSGMGLVAPTLLEHGSDDLKSRYLRPIVTGEHTWCQLFSEPGSGSDLAGLTTRADLDGDEWVINGQKVWNTSAHHAKYGMLLARTDWSVPKHRGITYLVLRMDQPGVHVRPLRQMNGYASFNEVFLTDARVPATDVVGQVGEGWRVALTTLAHERGLSAHRQPKFDVAGGRVLREAAAEAAEAYEPYRWYPQRAGRVDLIVERAKSAGLNDDPVVRQEIAALLSLTRAAQWTAQRAVANRALGRPPGAEGSLGKLNGSRIARAAAHLHGRIAGSSAMLAGSDSVLDGLITEILVSVPGGSIAGGTDEIQHNIIGERVLGLPKEPQTDTNVAFSEVPKNVARTTPGALRS
jgi:alkylation response protein AidB-like acyl-CoA dehydrogenase